MQTSSSHESRTHINKSEMLWCDTPLSIYHIILWMYISILFNLGIWQVRAGRGFATCLWNWDKMPYISSANSYRVIVTINFNWLHLKHSSPETIKNVIGCWDDWSSMNRSSRMYMQYAFKGTLHPKIQILSPFIHPHVITNLKVRIHVHSLNHGDWSIE